MTRVVRLTKKQKLLLRLLAARGEDMSRIAFQKYLFFFTRKEMELGYKPSFDFLPFHKGGFSITADMEWDTLVECGSLRDTPKRAWALNPYVALPPMGQCDMQLIHTVATELKDFQDEDLVLRMYLEYPEMAVRSNIVKDVLRDYPDAMARVEACKPRLNANEPLFGIGYEGLSIEEFFNRLYQHGVTILCDVRRVPFSHKKGFSKSKLSDIASAAGIIYKHLPELGIASHRRRNLVTQQDYDELLDEYESEDMPEMLPTLKKLARLIDKGDRIALMCFEALPQQCHRTRLVRCLSGMIGCPYRDLAGIYDQLCQKILNF